MAWIKNINQLLTNDYEEQYNDTYVKQSRPVNDEKGNIIARKDCYTRMYWYSDEDRLREMGNTWERPDKQTMRMRWVRKNTPRIEWYSDLNHGVNIYGSVYKYIEKHVGKSFSKTYSKFLFNSKYARYRDSNVGFYGYDSARRIFISSFGCKYRAYHDFYIDDNDIIRSVPSKPRVKTRDITVYLPENQRITEYTITPEKYQHIQPILRKYLPEYSINRIKTFVGQWWNYNISHDINKELTKTDRDLILKDIQCIRANKRKYIPTILTWLITTRTHYIDRVIKSGTRDWYIEKARQKRIKKYRHKHRNDFDAEFYDALLITEKHHMPYSSIREELITVAKQCKGKRIARKNSPTYFMVDLL